jgi:hypothetical protein
MTTFFSRFDKPLLTTTLYLETKNLAFTREPDGTFKSVLQAVAITFDQNGTAINEVQRTYTFRTTDKDYAAVTRNGVILKLQQVVLKPGPYQLRVAVRDMASQKMGSANQFIEVPDLKRRRLALSGIVLKQLDPAEDVGPASVGRSQAAALDPRGNEAIRIFSPGEKIAWYFQVFNARSGTDGRSDLKVQVRLFRDGSEVMHSEAASVHLPEIQPGNQLVSSGHMLLGSNLAPGDYALQLLVTDNLARRNPTASQWIDFQVQSP